jgi:AhpD family alkylhydroperoxidase
MPPLNLFRMVANAPSALREFLRYGGVLLSDLELDPVLRELAILRVAARTGCEYERTQHEQIAAAVGASRDRIAAALAPGAMPEGRDGLVLAFVDEAVDAHGASAETAQALERALGPRGVVELLLVVGHYLGIAVLVKSVDLDPDEPAGTAVLERAERQPDR